MAFPSEKQNSLGGIQKANMKETLKEFSPNTLICGLHFPGGERMSRTQLPSIFIWTKPSKTHRKIVKNDLHKTRKRRKDFIRHGKHANRVTKTVNI